MWKVKHARSRLAATAAVRGFHGNQKDAKRGARSRAQSRKGKRRGCVYKKYS